MKLAHMTLIASAVALPLAACAGNGDHLPSPAPIVHELEDAVRAIAHHAATDASIRAADVEHAVIGIARALAQGEIPDTGDVDAVKALIHDGRKIAEWLRAYAADNPDGTGTLGRWPCFPGEDCS